MRLKKSIPGNREFHSEHGRNLKPYYLVANIGQLLSAASLALAVFSILSDAIAGRGVSVATGGIVAAAVLIGVFIELANRTLARPSIKPLVVKDQFADNPDAAARHKTITWWSRAGLFAVGGLSLVLSFMGSMDAGKLISTPPPPAPLDSLNNAATEATQAVYAAFNNDTTVLLQPYRQRQQAAAQQFAATKAERTKAAEDYTGCANGGNKWCKKKRRAIFAEIDAAEAAYNAHIATVAAERGATLASAIQRRDAALATASGKSDSVTAEAKARAKAATDEAEAEAAGNGYIFAVLTFAGQIVFYLMFYLILTIEAGSEITEDLEPSEFSNLPTVVSDLKAVVAHRIERGARRLIAYIFGHRDRLDKPLPYVSLYPDKAIDENDPASVMKAEGIAPELTDTEAVATSHAPGFYRSADDPHKPVKDATPLTHLHTSEPTQKTVTTPDGKTLTKALIQSRVKMYRQRTGDAKQRAKVQQRKKGKVNGKTANAIANNQDKLEYYTNLLKQAE